MIRKLLLSAFTAVMLSPGFTGEWRLGLRRVAESVNRLVFGKV